MVGLTRFQPDGWLEALARPFSMALPDGSVYVEIIAPDLRFGAAILLLLLLLILRRGRPHLPRATAVLGGVSLVAFALWLATSGNGRYFLPFLFVIGPLAVALAHLLPLTRNARLATVSLVLLAHGLMLVDAQPWRGWGLSAWRDAPAFAVDVPPEFAANPQTFVVFTSISYSLIFPQFHPQSHWINLSALHPNTNASIEGRRMQALLSAAPRPYLLVPTVAHYTRPDGQPLAELEDVLDKRLAPYRIARDRTQACRVLPSRGAARMALRDESALTKEALARNGFWACALRYPVEPPASRTEALPTQKYDPVFDKLETGCPRFFPAGETRTQILPEGATRGYPSTDMILYVLGNDIVYYKYWRALNLVRIGTSAEVLQPGFQFDCSQIQGRGGPWGREI
jgi:hypothetical protein